MDLTKSKTESLSRRGLLLESLQANIEKLEDEYWEDEVATPKRRVSFNKRIQTRAFLKDHPAASFEEDEDKEEDSNLSDAETSGESEQEEEADVNVDMDIETDFDFDSLSPAEQLKLLMTPTSDEEGSEVEDEEEDDVEDEEGFDVEDEEELDVEEDDYRNTPKKLRLGLDEDEDSEEEAQIISTFEKQQERLKKSIAELEEENLSEKPWMLRGEVTAQSRPMNSLLEQDLDFEHAGKAAPIITEEVTSSLEAIIMKRIKDRAFDDPERKVISKAQPRRLPELDTEKSSKSLSQVYEDELTRTPSVKSDYHVDEATKVIHKDITVIFKKLCCKLDALSGHKFVPKAYSLDEVEFKLKDGQKAAAKGKRQS